VPANHASLRSWPEVAEVNEWQVLLLGNGLSMNVWPGFDYPRLFEHARDRGLTGDDLRLFGATPNFELVLADLLTGIQVNEALGIGVQPLLASYARIQSALGDAVRQVHLHRADTPDAALRIIREDLLQYEWIFTTSYDLILYWAMGASPTGWFLPLVDLFRGGNRLVFNPAQADPTGSQKPVYFLHGALHLVVSGDGVTWKRRRRELETLLDQFGQPIEGDPQARPLLVTEGSARASSGQYKPTTTYVTRSPGCGILIYRSSSSAADSASRISIWSTR
jgi:hypothetical protein